MNRLKHFVRRARRRYKCSTTAFLSYRYRYLLGFTLFGLISILVEIGILRSTSDSHWPSLHYSLPAFAAGLAVSFLLNATFNFRVPTRYFVSTFVRFTAVSSASFALNMLLLKWVHQEFQASYAASRLVCSGLLFFLAYWVHRKLTFRLDRNFGIAVYASPKENVRRIFCKVGRNCDHIHIDLVDPSYAIGAEVDLSKIKLARSLWPDVPFALHLMTRFPGRWVDATFDQIDWYLFSLASDQRLEGLIAKCQLAGKKVGVVWHVADPLEELYSYLPHVDFVMVLGIAKPGFSGQRITPEAMQVIQMLERIRSRYHFELMFDGSVNTETVAAIPARFIVAASCVLQSKKPVKAIYTLKTGARHVRRSA